MGIRENLRSHPEAPQPTSMQAFVSRLQKSSQSIAILACFVILATLTIRNQDWQPSVLGLEKYTYPDKSDNGIVEFLKTLESRAQNDGGDPEVVAWRNIDNHLANFSRSSLRTSTSTSMLDAGCGQGRLMVRYCSLFDHCMGIDADTLRVDSTRDVVSKTSVKNAHFHVSGAHNFKTVKKFDFIINSMVIQHVSPKSTAPAIMSNLVSLLQPEGILVVLTTFFPTGPFYHSVCVAEAKACTERVKPITAQQFEQETQSPRPNQLPVHSWSRAELTSLLTSAGCDVVAAFEFTYCSLESKGTFFRDYLKEGAEAFERRFGLSEDAFFTTPTSQGMVCKKK